MQCRPHSDQRLLMTTLAPRSVLASAHGSTVAVRVGRDTPVTIRSQRISERLVEQVVDMPVPQFPIHRILKLETPLEFRRSQHVSAFLRLWIGDVQCGDHPAGGGFRAELSSNGCAGSASDCKSTLRAHQMAPPGQPRTKPPR